MTPSHIAPKWQFQRRFRKRAFGWRGSRLAIERITEAISEIKKTARADARLGAEGAIALITRLSPALEQVDSSSGAIGSAVNRAIDELVPIIASAPASEAERKRWLEKLWNAFTADEMPYIELLGDRWGELTGSENLAAQWVKRLLPPLLESFANRRHGSYFQGTMACLSAMLAAKQYDEILEVLERAPMIWWSYRLWGFRALVAQGKRGEALRYAEASRGTTDTDYGAIARACEQLLLDSGLSEEAYTRYAIAASGYEQTYLARFRALSKKYPAKRGGDLLRDLVETTPGEEGKWFAAAKSAGLYDEAIALVQAAPCDPKTLGRAARDFSEKRPVFALEASLAALRWFAEGYGYEITSLDIVGAYQHGHKAAECLGRTEEFKQRAHAIVTAGDAFVRNSLRGVMASAL